MFAQPQGLEQLDGVGGEDVFCRFAGVEREQNGDQSTHNVRVAIALDQVVVDAEGVEEALGVGRGGVGVDGAAAAAG